MEHSIDEVTAEIKSFAFNSLKEKRYEHSVRVAETASLMCGIYGVDEKKGYLAGIAHDMCKCMSDDEILSLAAEDGMKISSIEKNKPALLHGRAAAILMRKKFSVYDEDVLQAVSCHTMGSKKLCPLAKIIYAADKIEPGRPQSTDEYRKNLFAKPLNEMTLFVVQENMAYLCAKGKKISRSSVQFEKSLQKEIKKESKKSGGKK